jgi:hypothetical protein
MQSVRVLEVVGPGVGARRSTLITIDGLNTASTTAKHSGSISRISITGLHSGVGVTRSTLIVLGSSVRVPFSQAGTGLTNESSLNELPTCHASHARAGLSGPSAEIAKFSMNTKEVLYEAFELNGGKLEV